MSEPMSAADLRRQLSEVAAECKRLETRVRTKRAGGAHVASELMEAWRRLELIVFACGNARANGALCETVFRSTIKRIDHAQVCLHHAFHAEGGRLLAQLKEARILLDKAARLLEVGPCASIQTGDGQERSRPFVHCPCGQEA